MTLSEMLKLIYKESKKELWKTQTTFAREFFKCAGSNFFLEDNKYNSYLNQIFNGSKPLSANIRDSFKEGVDIANLSSFFEKCINADNIVQLLNNFAIPLNAMQNHRCLSIAFAKQIDLFIRQPSMNENHIPSFYMEELSKNTNETTLPWKFTVVMMDDDDENLELLERELNELLESESRYTVDITLASSTGQVRELSTTKDIDIYVLDMAIKSGKKTGHLMDYYSHYGSELYRLLLTEKPNVLVRSKFIFYTKLPEEAIRLELSDIPKENLDVWKKGKISQSQLAEILKNYLDRLYIEEASKKAKCNLW